MKKLLFLLTAVLIFASCKKEEEIYTIKTQGDFTGEAYTFGATAIPDENGMAYYAWLTSTPYNGYNCFIHVFGSYSLYQRDKANYFTNTTDALYVMQGKRLSYRSQLQKSVDFDRVILTWNEKITKEEYDKLYEHYNAPRMKQVDGTNNVEIYFDEAEKVNVVR